MEKLISFNAKDEKDTYEFFLLAAVFNTDIGFAAFAEDLEREVLDIRLNLGIVELATNKMFCIENTGERVLGENLQDRWRNVHVVSLSFFSFSSSSYSSKSTTLASNTSRLSTSASSCEKALLNKFLVRFLSSSLI
jgi:hypothetical protein